MVLVDAPIDRRSSGAPPRVIQPIERAPLHTVLSIRLHWRAVGGALTTEAGVNAVLHWYVYGSPAGGPPSLVHYVGTAFVTLRDAGDGVAVEISHGSLALTQRYGDLLDPLGSFALTGSFHAISSDRQLHETLSDVRAAMDAAVAAAAEARPATRP